VADQDHTPLSGDERRADAVAGLRALADFLEETPAASQHIGSDRIMVFDYQGTREAFLAQAEAIGGPFEREQDPSYFKLVRRFGPFAYQLYTDARALGQSRPVNVKVNAWTLDDDVQARLDALAPSLERAA
jgi:hypothetical protein